MTSFPTVSPAFPSLVVACLAAAALAACGGGSGSGASVGSTETVAALPPPPSTTTQTLSIDALEVADPTAGVVLSPSFHLAPVPLEAPGDADAAGDSASVRQLAHAQRVPDHLRGVATRGLTLQALQQATPPTQRVQTLSSARPAADGNASALATTSVVSTYTPAQVRAAYGFPALPATGASLSAAQAAQLGAGQTVYIVDAMHDANLAAELAAFNLKFGLPTCTVKPLAGSTVLPLPAAAVADGCVLSVAYATAAGALSANAPAVDSGWATEIALDVEWAHATAPLARIVLIEVPDAALNSLLGGVKLANAMGQGVVSMSFGGAEGSWTASVDATFGVPGMSYLAATGDSGAGVSWPAVSSRVLAVGGTSLSYGAGPVRSETAWARTGGGVSAYTATPAYQSSSVPGVGALAHRGVADVAFNADPSTGQYVAVIAAGSSAVGWASAGGTSLATPQWAGLVAVANAVRAQAGRAPLGTPHAVLYGQIGAVAGNYAAAFADIRSGADGSCATCMATTGYDLPTGLGTPNVASLLPALTGIDAPAAAPVVAAASVSARAGTALTFNVAVSAANPVGYALVGAPAGMTIGSSGVVGWPKPVLGSYAVTVIATDTKTGLAGQGVTTVKVDAAASGAPTIAWTQIAGVAGKPLIGSFAVSDPANLAMTISIAGVPSGMGLSVSGQTILINWPKPVTGSYPLQVTVRDSAGQTAQATVPELISAK